MHDFPVMQFECRRKQSWTKYQDSPKWNTSINKVCTSTNITVTVNC